MSAAEVFLDSDVPAYLFSTDTAKAQRAESAIERGGTVSVQVLDEFASVGRRKVRLEFHEIREPVAPSEPSVASSQWISIRTNSDSILPNATGSPSMTG